MNREDVYKLFRDAKGEPQLLHCCVFYFDLLGTASMACGRNALNNLRRLKPALEAARGRAGTDDPDQTRISTWFTDNIVIATPFLRFPNDREGALLFTVVDMSYLFLILLEAGFLGRGAISVGEHYMDDRLVFGPALIKAVELEKATVSPRIALTDEAVQLVKEIAPSSGYGNPENVPLLRSLARDEDGTVFVDVFGVWFSEEDDVYLAHHLLGRHRASIEEGLTRTAEDPAVHQKWQWLADYFNWALSGPTSTIEEFRTPMAPETHSFSLFHETVEPFA